MRNFKMIAQLASTDSYTKICISPGGAVSFVATVGDRLFSEFGLHISEKSKHELMVKHIDKNKIESRVDFPRTPKGSEGGDLGWAIDVCIDWLMRPEERTAGLGAAPSPFVPLRYVRHGLTIAFHNGSSYWECSFSACDNTKVWAWFYKLNETKNSFEITGMFEGPRPGDLALAINCLVKWILDPPSLKKRATRDAPQQEPLMQKGSMPKKRH